MQNIKEGMSYTGLSFRTPRRISYTEPREEINAFWVLFKSANRPGTQYLNSTRDVWVLFSTLNEIYAYSINGRLHLTFENGFVNSGGNDIETYYPFYRDREYEGRYTLIIPSDSFVG